MKAKFMLFISVAVMYCTFLCGCHTSKKMDKTIPYEVAERYFVRNDVNGVPPTTITSAQEFEHYFGKQATKKRKLYNGMIKCDYYMYTDNSRKNQKRDDKK